MQVREARLEDARAIAELVVATWRAAYRGLLPDTLLNSLSEESSEVRWRERLAHPWGTTQVCELDGRVVGFVTYGDTRDEGADGAMVGEVYALYVSEAYWGHGCGYGLMAAALDGLRAQGKREVVLWTLRGNNRAIRFYERQGFAADGGAKQVTHSSGAILDEVRYRRTLMGAPHSDVAVSDGR